MVPAHLVLYQIMATNVLQKAEELFALAKALPTNGVFFRGDGPQFEYTVTDKWLKDVVLLLVFTSPLLDNLVDLLRNSDSKQEDIFVLWLNYRDHTTLFTTKEAERASEVTAD